MILSCNYCNEKLLKNFRIWILKDIKGFEQRELFVSRCDKCKQICVVIKEKRITDGKVFVNKIPKEKDALKTLARESKRIIKEIIDTDFSSLNGWVYGTNIEIKNKQGQVVQVRQYATDFNKKKELVKKIMVKNG